MLISIPDYHNNIDILIKVPAALKIEQGHDLSYNLSACH